MNDIQILCENDYVIAVNKPSGLPVQGGEKVKSSLDEILREKYYSKIFPVHRLDKDTSGLMITAKTKEAAAALSRLFAGKEKQIKKYYLAITAGIPVPAKAVIKLPLEIHGKVLDSTTYYRVLGSSLANGIEVSLLELELGSGRMHQIRRHLSAIGNPVIGDDKYGDFPVNRNFKKQRQLKKMLLHSYKLSIPEVLPYFPVGLDLEAPVPIHFTNFRLDNGLSFFSL